MPTTPATKDDLRTATREIIDHFNQSQAAQDQSMRERFDQVDAQLKAIMELLAMRQEIHNLVRELKGKGIELDPARIFVS